MLLARHRTSRPRRPGVQPHRQRKELTFVSGADICAAWLYAPAGQGSDGTLPLIVMAHGLTGARRDRLGPFAERFADAGVAAVVFDHRGFGDSTGEPDHVDPALQLEDWRAAIEYARSLPGIDPGRIATFGSSLGGGNALAAAAEDSAIAAAISQVPFLDRETQAYRSAPPMQAAIVAAAEAGGHLPAVGPPHEAAFINAPGAEAGWRHVVLDARAAVAASRCASSRGRSAPHSPTSASRAPRT